MLTATSVYRFGPFELDPATGRLFRGSVRVPLAAPHAAMLVHLVTHAGEVIPVDALAQAAWGTVAVTDNSVRQAISRLRKALGDGYIENRPNRGYCFIAPVTRADRLDGGSVLAGALAGSPHSSLQDADVGALIAACDEGRRHLETMTREGVQLAITFYDRGLRSCRHDRLTPALCTDLAAAHIGLTNAYALSFEALRHDLHCDLAALPLCRDHGQRGTEIAPFSGEAWSSRALALYVNGDIAEAQIAAGKAVELEPSIWHHRIRLGYVSFGEPRMQAASDTLKRNPELALAFWQQGTVFIGRGALEAALEVILRGCAAQDGQSKIPGPFPGVGLHLMHGLVLLAQGRLEEALREFELELAMLGSHLWARECAANTWYAIGAVRLHQRRPKDAEAAFLRGLAIAPGHLPSLAALGRPIPDFAPTDPRATDAAFARAIGLARAGRHPDAAQAYRDALMAARIKSAGWILPVEPVLNPSARPDIWREPLTIVRNNAM